MARGWKIWTALGIVYLVWGSTYFAIKVSVRDAAAAPLGRAAIHRRRCAAGGRSSPLRRTPLRVPWREARAAVVLGVMLLALWRRGGDARRDADRLERRRDDRRLRAAAGDPLAHARPRASRDRDEGRSGRRPWWARADRRSRPASRRGSAAIGLAIMLGASIAWSTGLVHLAPDAAAAAIRSSRPSTRCSAAASCSSSRRSRVGEGGDVLVPARSRRPRSRPGSTSRSSARWSRFTAYAWLLRNAPISQVVTHQYVNPLVAIVLGSAPPRRVARPATGVGALIVIGAVFATIRSESRRPLVPRCVEADAAAPPIRAR